MDFKNKRIVITGGAQGIGKEIAKKFSSQGADLALFDLNESVLQATVEELNQQSKGRVIGFKVDVTSYEDVAININKVVDNFSGVDILINNAGITRDSLMIRLSENDWDKVIAVNLKGAFNCTKAVLKPMMKQQYGRIINISSVIGIMGNPGQVNYAASKAGLIGMTRTLAKELGSRNITVNAIAPGYIKTAMTDQISEKVREQMLARIPLKRFGTPEDVAYAVMFLASDYASYVTGQILVVDGGLI